MFILKVNYQMFVLKKSKKIESFLFVILDLYDMPNINSALIRNLCCEAEESTLQQRLAAAVVQNSKQLSHSCCNINRNFCRRRYIPSVHAETRALLNFYGNKVYYNKYKGWKFYDEKYRKKNICIMVVRVSRNGNLANARPCRNCLSMMKDLGVKRVHYSTGDDSEIITENVTDMFSIQDSSSNKHFTRMMLKYPKNDIDYYKYILRKNSPKVIKLGSFEYFIRFNLSELLPECTYSFVNKKGTTFVDINDNKQKIIIRIQIW